MITYDGLPVSSGGGHTLKTRNPLVALDQVEGFIAACAKAVSPMEASVSLVEGTSVPREFFRPLHDRFSEAYGPPRLQRQGSDRGHRWKVPREDARSLAALVASLQPLPKHPFGLVPVCVELDLTFHLKASRAGDELPIQGRENYMNFVPGFGQLLGESRMYARLSEKSGMSLFLNFPFSDATPDFLLCRAHVQEHLPFKLSEKHWKKWCLTRKGDTYVGRKIQMEL